MASQRISPAWEFLHHASIPSLESFELSRLNHSANLRKEVAALLEQWIEEMAEARMARWIREHRNLPQRQPRPVDILPQPELPFSAPQPISIGPRHAERRLRSRRVPSAPA